MDSSISHDPFAPDNAQPEPPANVEEARVADDSALAAKAEEPAPKPKQPARAKRRGGKTKETF